MPPKKGKGGGGGAGGGKQDKGKGSKGMYIFLFWLCLCWSINFTKHRTLKCKLFWNACTFCHFRNSVNLFKLYTVRHLNFKITGVGIKFVIP